MKKSLLVAAVLLSIGSGCLMPQEAGASTPEYYWDKTKNEWSNDYSVASSSGNDAKLPIEGFTVSEWDNFYAGYSAGDVKNNSFTVDNITTKIDTVVGGYSLDGNAVGNTVAITGSSNAVAVYGGVSEIGNAKGNTVTISDESNVSIVAGGYSGNGNAEGNTVTITGSSEVKNVFGGFGADSEGNTVVLNGGKTLLVYGGGFEEEESIATGNTVRIHGGKHRIVVGGAGDIKVQGNEVVISIANGEDYVDEVFGGMTIVREDGDYSFFKDNIVTWKEGKIEGSIYGGVWQGYFGAVVEINTNILNVYHSSGSSSKTIAEGESIAGFDRMNFYLSGDVKDGSIIVDNSKGTTFDLANIKEVKVANDPDKTLDTAFVQGNKVILLNNTTGTVEENVCDIVANGMDYEFTVKAEEDQNQLVAISSDGKPKGPNEESKSLLEGHAAAALAVNQMVDNTINVALKDAELAASENADGNSTNNNFNAFISANYNKDRISTGSYVDVKGLSGTIGIARKLNNKSGTLTYGLFLEGGKNKFDTSNDFASGSVHGKGDANSFGGGLFAKQKNANGMYVEGSLRVGRVNHDFEGFVAKQNAEYDAKSTYYGAHIGLGKLINAGKGEWDVYGKLIYTHINGATANVYDGSELELDAMNSTRLRVGGRYNVNPAPKAVGYYAGLAYEYEFGGQADGKLQGFGLEAPTSKGSTGILELGAKFQPTQNFGIDLGVEGHAGKRRGVGGNVNFKWSF